MINFKPLRTSVLNCSLVFALKQEPIGYIFLNNADKSKSHRFDCCYSSVQIKT